MHPAPSIIVFTVLSGLGFGLLAFLGLGLPVVTGWTALVFFAIAYLLAVGGLAASTFHLGHPERAVLALTQWRSSWLSREGVFAIAALLVMAAYGAGLVFFQARWTPLGWVGTALSLATVFATSMIYAQLKTVPRWHHWSTPVLFVAYAVAGGALLAGQIALAAPLLLVAGAAQLWVWQVGDTRLAASGTTLGTATGLGGRGGVRSFEKPHTGPNYLTKEMIHIVGRRHALKLRIIGFLLLTVVPWLILVVLPFSHALAGLAVLSHIAGAFIARWLFFAEAEHVVGLYYGAHAPPPSVR
ncbi:MAG: dimethyl sulfoxide reductase anchor subunit [Paracoccaceae bacterium]|nr:dimethyl sulfoxide reductase anchor subunit [Paracoccaceae bacterium]